MINANWHNVKFETILKIRPSNGETLEKLLKTENGKLIINESEIAKEQTENTIIL